MTQRVAELRLDDRRVRQLLKRVDAAAADVRPVWDLFHQYMRTRVAELFRRMAPQGGSWRGVTWAGHQPQYTRKTDGVEVPAWGGVAKLRGRGQVQGRLRPSGTRVTPASNILQDTGTLMARAAASVFARTSDLLRFGTTLQYATRQHEQRPFLFFALPDDADELGRLLSRWFRERV